MFPINTTSSNTKQSLSSSFNEAPITSSSSSEKYSGNTVVKRLDHDEEIARFGAVPDKSGNTQKSRKRSCSDSYDTALLPEKIAKSESFTFSENSAAGFDMVCSNLSSRQINNLSTEASTSVVSRKIGVLLTHENILDSCEYLKLPFTDLSGKKFNLIKTYFCNNQEILKKILTSLPDDELAFTVVVQEKSQTEEILTVSLFSNDGDDKNEIKIKRLFDGDTYSGLEFFDISFSLEYSENGELKRITPARSVHGGYRKNGICTSISLAVLELIQQHMGTPTTVLNSATARHIGTVKFYYPLNRLYNKMTGVHLRDIDPRQTTLKLSDIEAREESLLDFEVVNETYATCPHATITLVKLLSQYQLRKAFDCRN